MARFQFRSSGAAMGDAFLQTLIQREAMRRQAMIDEQNRRESEATMARQKEQLELQRAAEARAGDAERRMTQMADDDWARERTDRAGADERVSPEEIARLEKGGYGGRVDTRLGSSSMAVPIMPFTPDSPVTTPQVAEGGAFLRPGFQYEQMRAAEESRKQIAAANAAADAQRAQDTARAQAERAAADRASREAMAAENNQTRMLIAGMGAAQKAEAAAEKKAAADEKKAEADLVKQRNTEASIKMRDDVIYRVDQLLDIDPKTNTPRLKPGVGALYGSVQGALPEGAAALFGGKEAGNARAALNGLISLLDIETIKSMKEQSRTGATGFGALSEKELAVLENAATTLRGRTMDESSALRELVRIRNEMVTARANTEKELARQRSGGAGRGRVLSVRPAGQ